MTDTKPEPALVVRGIIDDWRLAFALKAALDLDLPLRLREPRPAEALANELNCDSDRLQRLLRFLVVHGFFAEDSSGCFRHNDSSLCLTDDHPDSMAGSVRFYLSEWSLGAFSSLGEAIHKRQAGIQVWSGQPLFEFLSSHPKASETFNRAMKSRMDNRVRELLDAYKFDPTERLLDVGGGLGHLVAGVLVHYPTMTGGLFNLPEVIAQAQQSPLVTRLGNRLSFHTGSFFDALPAGFPVHILALIIHDWLDEAAQKILENCRAAQQPGQRVLLFDRVLEPGTEKEVRQIDLTMIAHTDGRERSRDEFARLLRAAGYELVNVHGENGTLRLLEAIAR